MLPKSAAGDAYADTSGHAIDPSQRLARPCLEAAGWTSYRV
jgi:hypothetical protein